MRLGHDTVVALFSRRGDNDATVQADLNGGTGEEEGSSRSRLIPLAIIAVMSTLYGGIAAYWLATGAPPSFLVPSGQRAKLNVPPRTGPESRQSALLQPPLGPDARADASAPDAISRSPEPQAPPQAPPQPQPPAAAPPVKPPMVIETPIPTMPAGPSPVPQLAHLPPPKAAPPLPPAPIPDLVRMTANGPLPVIAPDGRAPWQTYARPFSDNSGRARIAVIVSGLGLGKAVTEAAISRLPADVTLSFSPYAKDVDAWLKRARAAGHEVMLDLPLEAARFPERDPGPMALLQTLPDVKLKERLEAVLTRGTGYVGLLAGTGSPFATSDRVKPVLEDARKRGLLYVGDLATLPADPNLQPAFAAVAVSLDGQPFRAAIDARLGQAVDAAKARGSAVAIAQGLPVVIDRLAHWLTGLGDKGMVIAPVSALAKPPVSLSVTKDPS